ncbi:MAG: phosphate ABC transporter substrate-binding protein PstS [Burkholderiaceae bacterium]|nr:phosphate ABC transporter substrate-binding protein PstS [Burkholderiaceae bacterium]
MQGTVLKNSSLWLAGLFAICTLQAAHADIGGAGASFPAPVIEAWSKQFALESKIEVGYRSVGSAEGIRRVTAHGADFGVSDVPLTQAELAQDDLLQFPIVVGGIVPVVNIPGIDRHALKLTGTVLADIYLGKITNWNAEAIRALNPELSLPDLVIKVVHRADGSGSSFVFTRYLSGASADWQEHYGIASRMHWPAGSGANGSSGVAQYVKDNAGAIGYVEYSYVEAYSLGDIRLRNKAGHFVAPDLASFRAALASANWSRPSFYEILTDAPGEQSWPIVGASYVLIHKRQQNASDGADALKFFDWILHSGSVLAEHLRYVPLENRAIDARIEASWKDIRDEHGSPVWKGR